MRRVVGWLLVALLVVPGALAGCSKDEASSADKIEDKRQEALKQQDEMMNIGKGKMKDQGETEAPGGE
jgi:hypothetical protein